MQIPDDYGHPSLHLGQVGSAGARLVALSISALQPSLGAARFEKDRAPLGPTRHEPVTIRPQAVLDVAQISFFNDPAGRAPQELLQAWPALVDVADAACRSGIGVSVIQASSHLEHLQRNGVHYYFMPF